MMGSETTPGSREGEMDIAEQQRTWKGFMEATKWFSIIVAGLVVWLVGAFILDFSLFGWTAVTVAAVASAAYMLR